MTGITTHNGPLKPRRQIHHITSSTTQSTETRIKKYQNHRRFGPLLLQHDKNFKPCLIILGNAPSGTHPFSRQIVS